MADIVKCAGGELLDYTPSAVAPGDKVVVVTCEEDMSGTVSDVPLCSTELILGGVLRQEIDIDKYPNYDSIVVLVMFSTRILI